MNNSGKSKEISSTSFIVLYLLKLEFTVATTGYRICIKQKFRGKIIGIDES